MKTGCFKVPSEQYRDKYQNVCCLSCIYEKRNAYHNRFRCLSLTNTGIYPVLCCFSSVCRNHSDEIFTCLRIVAREYDH